MPTKLLKPKNMRRGILALLLVAPLVYLFGSLFTALNGSHQSDFDGQDTITYVQKDKAITANDELKLVMNETLTLNINGSYYVPYISNGVSFTAFTVNQTYSSVAYYNQIVTRNVYYGNAWSNDEYRTIYMKGSSLLGLSSNVRIFFDNNASYYFKETISESDYLFGQFFAMDNWLAEIGDNALADSSSGGLPFVNDLISYVDTNLFDLSSTSYGSLIWGYVVYAFNVVLIYEVVSIAVSLMLLPLKAVDLFDKEK